MVGTVFYFWGYVMLAPNSQYLFIRSVFIFLFCLLFGDCFIWRPHYQNNEFLLDLNTNYLKSWIYLQLILILLIYTCFLKPFHNSHMRASVFFSVKHIYKVDGLRGCYRGFYPWLSTNLLFKFTVTKVKETFPKIPNEDRDEDELTDDER